MEGDFVGPVLLQQNGNEVLLLFQMAGLKFDYLYNLSIDEHFLTGFIVLLIIDQVFLAMVRHYIFTNFESCFKYPII